MKKLLTTLALLIIPILSCVAVPSFTALQSTLPTYERPAIAGTILQSNTEVYFPQQNQDPSLRLTELYGSCNQTLDIAIYSLTHPVIVKAIGDAYKRGVQVRIITDKVQASGNTQKHAMNDLLTIGIPIKVDSHSGLMHLKMSTIDRNITTTGSYNYSMGASEDNDEIFVVIKEAWFAEVCQQEFNRMWSSPQFIDLGMSY